MGCVVLTSPLSAVADDYHLIHVVDADSLTGVSNVKLTTKNKVEYTSDANGFVAFLEPGLMDETVWFGIEAQGYEAPSAFGISGTALDLSVQGVKTIWLEPVGAPGPASTSLEHSTAVSVGAPEADDYHRITVIDSETGRGVPLVELSSDGQTFITDSQGEAAVYYLEAMGQTRTFTVTSHGYSLPTGSVSLSVDGGGWDTIEVDRQLPAERLYRSTGAGIYDASVRLELETPLQNPLLNARVSGQDTVQTIPFDGDLYWFWGDTLATNNVLGNFRASGATSTLPEDGGLEADLGVDFDYFETASGGTAAMAPDFAILGSGAAWIGAPAVVPDESGDDLLVVSVGKWGPGFQLNRRVLAGWNPALEHFEELMEYDLTESFPSGHSFIESDTTNDYLHFQNMRVDHSLAGLMDQDTYEVWTAIDGATGAVLRDADGLPDYQWRASSRLTEVGDVDSGALSPSELQSQVARAVVDGARPDLTGGSAVTPNGHRGRYVRIVQQSWGATSLIGELWYGEADTPVGPWLYSTQVITHNDYSFYNPRIHPYLSQDGESQLFFEGTYTSWLSSSAPTPRYDYNQVMYRLDLDRPEVILPVPIYDLSGIGEAGVVASKDHLTSAMDTPAIAFFAPEREGRDDLVPVGWTEADCANPQLAIGELVVDPLFYGYPPDVVVNNPDIVPVYAFTSLADNSLTLSTAESIDGFDREDLPLALVWESPYELEFPVIGYLSDTQLNAGDDQCLTGAFLGWGAAASLEATMSSPEDDPFVSWEWTWEDGTAAGQSVEPYFAEGAHAVELVATTASGLIRRDQVVINVAPGEPLSCSYSVNRKGRAPLLCLALVLLGLGRRRRRRPGSSTTAA